MATRIVLLLAIGCLVSAAVEAAAESDALRTVHCGGFVQSYLEYSPDKGRVLPAVVLLHGAGDQPGNMMDAWRHLARKKNIVLLAPQLPRDVHYENAAPEIFRCVVEDARQHVGIDGLRVYLFGNSMGGYLAFDGAMFQSLYFAAVAVHAMRIAKDYEWIVSRAQRKTPIAIYIGDHDQFFSIDDVRQTRNLLRKAGFPVHYLELEDHDHNYYALADAINGDVWRFFEQNRLPR